MKSMSEAISPPAEATDRSGLAASLEPSAKGRLRTLVIGAFSICFALLVWHVSSQYIFNPVLVPSPAATFHEAVAMIASGELFEHVGVSLKRVLVGFAAGSFVGIVAGMVIGRVRLAREFCDPLIELIRPISPVAMIPLSILWFGIGELSRYFIIFYATVLVVALNTAAGVTSQPITRARAARSLGASELKIFTHVVLPTAVPSILTGMRIAVGFSFMGVVAAEMIGANTGIGYLIMQSRQLVQPERMFVGLVTLSVVGLATDRAFRLAVEWTTRRFTQYQTRS